MTLLTSDPLRWGGALLASGLWLGVCLRAWRGRPRKPQATDGADAWLLVYASQTGNAERIAQQTAALLAAGGEQASVVSIADLDPARLRTARRALFIASTYGEGDAPDAAARFVGNLAGRSASGSAGAASCQDSLASLRYAVLALGDRHYAHFCGFGRALDAWLQAQGATRLFARIDVDRGDPAALAAWQRELGALLAHPAYAVNANAAGPADWHGAPYADWRIAQRTLLNAGSSGNPLYLLALAPADPTAPLPDWQAGDLAQVGAPGDPDHPRDYSIASVPRDGRLELLVRLRRRADGGTGVASGWLCEQADGHDQVRLRIRPHERFRLGANAHRPLVFIGNGSGLAGLRGLIKARIALGCRANWLVFGERNAACDFLLREELQCWLRDGWLARLDLAFSRDGAAGRPRYVQDVLRAQAAEVAAWMRRGAAVYVCGSLEGMAGGVHAALQEILGADVVDALASEGRYRRDVY